MLGGDFGEDSRQRKRHLRQRISQFVEVLGSRRYQKMDGVPN
jgi:hypothetical protein